MDPTMNKLKRSTIARLYYSFDPSSRAAILFVIPFLLVDAIHYYTAGTALLFSFPLLLVIYLLCGGLAAKFAYQEKFELTLLSKFGRNAGLRLWLSSTVFNTLLAIILGVTSLGLTLLGSAVYLCLFAPLNALAGVLIGWLGGWLYQEYIRRVQAI